MLLLADYIQGTNRTDWKPPLYLSVRVIKFLPDRRDLCIDEWKKDVLRRVDPYHLNVKDNLDLEGPPLLIEDGVWCHYPDSMQSELGLYSWADQACGPWVVAIVFGIAMHYTMVFCTQSLNPTMLNWQDCSHGAMDGNPYMKLLEELADLLSGELTTVVMQSNKAMIALY